MKFVQHTVVNAPAERVDLEDWVWRLATVGVVNWRSAWVAADVGFGAHSFDHVGVV
jgi:hypothetical protein